MSVAVLERPVASGDDGTQGAMAARRAVVRWAWRLFRREWRQQILVLALVAVAVAATVVGAAVATNTPPSPSADFGAAGDLITVPGSDPQLASQVAALQRRFGQVDIIENQTLSIPGSVNTFDLRAQNPLGAFGQPMLDLVSGRYPAARDEVAVTPGVASEFNLRIGDTTHFDGSARRVVGIVQNPMSLLDEFALVLPGQVRNPGQVTILFNAPGVPPSSIGPNVLTPSLVASNNALNPTTVVLALATLGMLLIALVAAGGFTVLAQRRLRGLGMLETVGATDKQVRLVVRANGVVVGVIGTVIGFVVGLVAWFAYRPHVEASSHHLIGAWALPWDVIAPAMALGVVATFLAAARPARTVTRVPIVRALSGRPVPPRMIHRSATPGVVAAVVAFFLFSYSGSKNNGGGGGPELVLGFVVLIAAVILLAPLALGMLARIGGGAPIAVRMALRDLARYRARSGSALAAIALGVLIAVVICVLASARYSNVLDYAGPNLASNQLIVYTPSSPQGGGGGPGSSGPSTPSPSDLQAMTAKVHSMATALGARDIIELDSTSANLNHAARGRNFNGQIYLATPQLLRAFGISSSRYAANADILTMRPGLSSITEMQLQYGNGGGPGPQSITPGSPGPGPNSTPCPAHQCLADPVIDTVSALPSGTSAPNTVITEHAVHQLGLQTSVSGWLIQTDRPLTASQITNTQATAAAAGLTIETKNDSPTSAEVINWATVFGVVLALGILAMTVGLIRSETASDLRTLTATGAGSATRRTLAASTAGALALLGAVLGTAAGYLAALGWFSNNANDGLSELTSVPLRNLLVIVVGMPLVAAATGWLLAGREPKAIAHQPIE
jgi:putative ABC transport system permease protein